MGSLAEEVKDVMTPQNNLKKTTKRICVYCGSRAGFSSEYAAAAKELGEEMVRRGIDLVYGGGSIGMMGVISKTVHEGGGAVVGVIPEALIGEELTGLTVGTTIEVQNMHERKAKMASLADCFIALPGGYGTLEELMEMITWYHLGIHNKPVGVLNINKYYDPLLQMFDKMVETGFVTPDQRHVVVSAPTPAELIDQLDNYGHPEPSVARHRWQKRRSLGYGDVGENEECEKSGEERMSEGHAREGKGGETTEGKRAVVVAGCIREGKEVEMTEGKRAVVVAGCTSL